MGGRFFYFGVQPAGDFCVWGGGERKAFPYECESIVETEKKDDKRRKKRDSKV